MASLAQRRRALQAADELHNDLGLDQEIPVDVFEIVDQLGLWLVFNRLDNLLGAVLPRGDGGIMVTTQRGPAVQRYTVAHEIGHWILDYGEPSFDTEDEIYYPTVDREYLAQLFAGQLLMPPPLVYATCNQYGVTDSQTATPSRVYQVARDMGASYEATTRQLTNLEIVDRSHQERLLATTPIQVKTELGKGHRPTGSADVWPVELTADEPRLRITEGDEVLIALPENRTTGHRWLTPEEVEGRSDRIAAPRPPVVDEPPADLSRAGTWTPGARQESTTASVRTALARVPGASANKRILPIVNPDDLGGAESPTILGALETVPPALNVVDDRYRASWTDAAPSSLRALRRSIAVARPSRSVPGARAHDDVRGNIPVVIPVSGTGTRLIALRSAGEGVKDFDLFYTSAYDPSAPTVESYHLHVEVVPAPARQNRRLFLSLDLDDDLESENLS